MEKPASILLLCVLLGFGLSTVIPAEDLPETAYDESESFPYVIISAFTITVLKPAAQTPAARNIIVPLGVNSLNAPARQFSSQWADSSCRICDSFVILDQSLRC